MSNIHARDELHRHSKLSSAVKGVICGLGPYGYILAMQAAADCLGELPDALLAPARDASMSPRSPSAKVEDRSGID